MATSFIHLLQPANENLSDECLGGTFEEYPWAYGICLMALFALFFFELLAFNYVNKKVESTGENSHSHSHFGDEALYTLKRVSQDDESKSDKALEDHEEHDHSTTAILYPDHFQHASTHQDPENLHTPLSISEREKYYGQLVSTVVLEFGIIFHSVFVGLTLAVSGEEFRTLYVVIVFHQMFEGLGLGTRIATTSWPKDKKWIPYVFAGAYGLTTPISIAIGLGVRNTYAPGSRTALITNGVFDAVSAGILIYAGIVELLAHEFLYSDQFKGEGGTKRMLIAYLVVCFGAGVMALLGRWA